MAEKIELHDPIVAPDDVHQSLLTTDGSDVHIKAGPVTNVQRNGDKHQIETIDELVQYKKPKDNQQFIGLTKEELKEYINNPKWKRIRWIIALLYLLILALLLIGSIVLVITSQRCPPKPQLQWYQKDIIYEIDVPLFQDSNDDGIGDIKGVEDRLKYFEKNQIKSLLFQSSIFNGASGNSYDKNIDLMTLNSSIGSEKDLQDFIKILNRKDMHLVIDLPLSSARGLLSSDPCAGYGTGLNCRFYRSYGRSPLDFADKTIQEETKSYIKHWLSTKKVDGIRVNLPLEYDTTTNSYKISSSTIKTWNELKNEIEKKTKPKLLLYDIPIDLQDIIDNDDLNNKIAHSLYVSNDLQRSSISASKLNTRIQSFNGKQLSNPQFWQLGSKRKSDGLGILNTNQLPKEMVLTTAMLLGGTPIVLYGEEIGLDQKSCPLMSWSPEKSGGSSYCSKTSVKLQEALGGQSKDSILKVFRRLSELRTHESFQHGILQTGCNNQSNLFWFIREAPGHRGYIVLLNLNTGKTKSAHISLPSLTHNDVPLHIHNEYQWPKYTLPKSNSTHIDSDNLLISSQSINIFSWAPKMVKPEVLNQQAAQHQNTC